MEYGLKYWNEFKNYYDETIRIEIRAKILTDDTTAEEIKTGASPLIISYPGDDNYLFNPIIGSEAQIQLFSDTNFKFISLHNSDSRAHRVDIYKEDALFWQGWILPDLFSEPYIAPPYIVTVTARCGLGELKETLIKDSTLPELSTLYEIFKYYLLSINPITVLNDCINVIYEDKNTADYSPIALTKINIAAFGDMTAYESLSDILLSFGARLYQINSEWFIVRANELQSVLTIRKWDLTDDSWELIDTEIKTFLISRPAGSQIVNESPQLDVLPAWKKLVWLQDLGKYESFIENYDFTKWENDYRRSTGGNIGRAGITNFIIKNWIESELNIVERKTDQSDNDYAQFTKYTLNDITDFITQRIENVFINDSQKVRIKIKFDVLASDISSVGGSTFPIEIKITNGINDNYLKFNLVDSIFEWTIVPTLIFFENIPYTWIGDNYTNWGNTLEWDESQIIAPGFNVSGTFEIKIYAAYAGYLRLQEVSCKLIDINEIEYQEETETIIPINENNIYTPDTIELVSGDLPDIINSNLIWQNGYRKYEGLPTSIWRTNGNAEDLPLLKLIGKDYQATYKTPQFKLTLPILSRTIQFDSCIVDYLILAKKYICASAEIDMQTCIFRGSFMEFSIWEGAKWILENGSWNDDGIWIDDETWKDDDSNFIVINFSGGVGLYDLSEYLSVTDTIVSLPPYGIPGIGGLLKEDEVFIVPGMEPYVITNSNIGFIPNLLCAFPMSTNFNAIVSGTLKTIVINVST